MTVAARDLAGALSRASGAIGEAAILDATQILMAVPGPPGAERTLAEHVARWGRAAYPELDWDVDALDADSASLVVRSAHGDARRELGLYAHLDTSLTGDPARDLLITGEVGEVPAFSFDAAARSLRGLGVGIARAPSAAAIVSLAASAAALRELKVAHRVVLLLAAGGTHRATPTATDEPPARFGRGVVHALAGGWRPSAVLSVKGGPSGVLHQEPATAYLRVRLRSRWTAALVRATVAPHGGLVRHAGEVLDAIEAWRSGYLAAHPPQGQLGCEISVGALRGGSPEKADLIPGLLEVFLYAILPPDEDPARVARDLEAYLAGRLASLPVATTIAADAYVWSPGGSTDSASEIVRLAREAWKASFRSDPDAIRGWTGATDGAALMAAGIPTARLGAGVKRDEQDPRIEIVDMDQLLACARAWLEVAVRYCAA